MTPDQPTNFNDPATLAYRLGVVETTVTKLDTEKADKDFVERLVGTLESAMTKLSSDLSGLRQTIIYCACGAAGSAFVAAGLIILNHA